jgi:hypothetical protein
MEKENQHSDISSEEFEKDIIYGADGEIIDY